MHPNVSFGSARGAVVAAGLGACALLWLSSSTVFAGEPSFAAGGGTGLGGAETWTAAPFMGGAHSREQASALGSTRSVVLEARGIMGDGRLAGDGESGSPFGGERAKILLRSLTLPGWGQATLGRKTSAWVFGLAEVGIWTSFTTFKVQEQLRRESYEKSALLFAGVDLNGRDDEFRRIVGSYLSNEEYNQLVVFRDAANQFYDDPVAYRQYIAEHSIGGANSWAWADVNELIRYRTQRQREQRAANRANTALALAIGNRLLSAIHAARFAQSTPAEARSWQIEYGPAGEAVGDFRVGVRTRF
jgi:hypothetical protein